MTATNPLRVVVIGATGNIGTAVVRELVRSSRVGAIEGVARRLPHATLMAELPDVRWSTADVAHDALDLVEGADVVVHLAWRIQQRDERAMWATNVDGTQRVIDAVVRHRVPALVYASSIGTYASGPKAPVDERYSTTGIGTSTYSRHKAEVERRLSELERAQPWLRVVRMRTSLVVQRSAASEIHRLFLGPFLPWHLPRALRFVPSFDRLAVQMTHADDVASAYLAAITGDARGAFNIAADPVLSPSNIASAVNGRPLPLPFGLVRALTEYAYRLRLQPCEAGWADLIARTPLLDSSRARRELGWRPRIDATAALVELLDGIGDGAGGPTEPLLARRHPLPSSDRSVIVRGHAQSISAARQAQRRSAH